MKLTIIAMVAALAGITSPAQEAKVALTVSETASNQIAEMQASGIPMDYVINAGYAQSVARIKTQLTMQIDGMNLEQLLLAYPKFSPLVDTNDRVEIAESFLRTCAKNEVQRVKTVSAAAAAYDNQQAIIKAHPHEVDVPDRFKLKVDSNGVATVGNMVVSTNANGGQ